ncbi:hypothetical protein M0R88_14340 [Halorussus gelatinilyticus]|uniref:DUF8070 domain-containing protein n=1 Tax=Halorussus gelatinilyticus TaxID=2937524 RepID=A0A8U0IF43_9EURY|nr:hypothetical protein [Halorussus gelatinilyticus]UPV99686.1 hypothetical protein M0R88_14340 [Halorussus gelatinilyticus]
MDWNALVAPVVSYTLVAAAATVGVAYLVFSSGLTLLLLAGAGVLLVVLGAGEAGAAPASGFGMAEDSGMGGLTEGMEMLPGSSSDLSVRAKMLFYGLGLVAWTLAGLAVLLR